jgi:hypothetical protein
MEIADHESRRIVVVPLPCLGDPDRGRAADTHNLARDLTPSLGRYAPPTRALEHGAELAVRVAEAARISISTVSGYDWHPTLLPGRRRSGRHA